MVLETFVCTCAEETVVIGVVVDIMPLDVRLSWIIYDTPQESRTSRGMMSTTTPITTVSSAQVQTNVSNTTTTSQPDTSNIPQTDPVDTSNQQTSGQSYTPPPSSPPSGGGSSGSGGGSSGGGGYGGGY